MAVPKDLQELLEAGAHFGHQVRRWNPKMSPFIYSVRDGVHVFDLTITAKKLDEACVFIEKVASEGKTVVFIGTKRQAKEIVREEATKVGANFITERWLGGAITNWDEIYGRIKKLNEMKAKREVGDYKKYTKKERVLIDRDISRLDRFLGGIANLTKLPDVLFVVDVNKEKVAVTEAGLRNIPVVALIDSNSNPEGVAYPVPANDDAVRSIKYIVHRIAEAFSNGRAKAPKREEVVVNQKQAQVKKS